MIIGTTKELKNHEYRVGLTPDGVKALVRNGHTVYVEKDAGLAAGFNDQLYKDAGATILDNPKDIYEKVEMLVKVKEPEPSEYEYLKKDLILYTYLHLAANKELADELIKKNVKAIAFETIKDCQGNLPCLRPMSQIAGRLSIQEGAKYIERSYGGRGIILGGVPGVQRGNIVILGGGIAGTYAAKAAVGIDANVTLLDINLNRLSYIEDIFGASVTTLYSSEENIRRSLAQADLVIGSVLIPGGSTPKLIKREYLKEMKRGAVIVDIAIDQGGCCESSHVTTHDNPVFIEEGIVHYCVGNMPGAVPYTSTVALSNATFPYALKIANQGLEKVIQEDDGFKLGVNIYNGKCTNINVAQSLNYEYVDIKNLI